MNYLRGFNQKYETVESSLTIWKNATDCLHFAQAFENFKINVNIIKSSMMGYNGNEETINSLKIAKMLKDVIQLSSEFDFGGIKSFES